MEPLLTVMSAIGNELTLYPIDDPDEVASCGLVADRAIAVDIAEGNCGAASITLDADGAAQLRDALTAWLSEPVTK